MNEENLLVDWYNSEKLVQHDSDGLQPRQLLRRLARRRKKFSFFEIPPPEACLLSRLSRLVLGVPFKYGCLIQEYKSKGSPAVRPRKLRAGWGEGISYEFSVTAH